MRQEGHAVYTLARSAGEPALESRVCHACRGTRLVTDPTGTVHARGSEMKMRDCCTAARTASTLLAMSPDASMVVIASLLRLCLGSIPAPGPC